MLPSNTKNEADIFLALGEETMIDFESGICCRQVFCILISHA